MSLSVVIVNWNGRDDLRGCLDSLRAQTVRDFDTIVVDNGSDDGSAAMVRNEYREVELVEAGDNLGFAEGCNRGIEASRGEWAFMLNNDTVADARWAETLLAAIDEAPAHCGMVQSMLLFMDRPDTINSTGIRLRPIGRGSDRQEGSHRSEASAGPIFCPTAGAAAYRRSMLDAVAITDGYFDRRHFCYLEDLDLGWRARLAGWSAWVEPASWVLHRYHGSSRRRGESWLRLLSNTNHYRTIVKNASWSLVAGAVPKCLVEAAQIARHGGSRGMSDAAEAIAQALEAREEVERMRVVDRQAVEARWIGV